MKKQSLGQLSPRDLIYEIIRIACVIFLLIFIIRQFGGTRISNAAFADVEQAVMQDMSQEKLQPGDNQMIKRLYGLDPSAFENVLLYYPTTNMGAEEIFLVQLSDVSGQQEMVQTAIEGRLATQKKNFDGYGTYQTAMLEASQIVVRGNYILFVSAENPDTIVQNFEAAL